VTRRLVVPLTAAVAFSTDGTIVGLDLGTGRRKWSSEVPRDDVNGLTTKVGSGVVVFRENGQDPLGQVVLDSATGEELTGAVGFVVADQELLLEIENGVATPVTVDDLR
jgi:outer membrane protein assembly factor BamB